MSIGYNRLLKNQIVEYVIDIGIKTIKLPVFDSGVSKSGKTILITAGMDGDEYAGIEAAKELIKIYQNKNISGRLIIIPLVNIPGYEIGHSRNPLDGKYPKRIYPGKPNGTTSERIIWWIHNKYIKYSDVWIDLHSGATDEMLTPFVCAYQTGNIKVDQMTQSIIQTINSDTAVCQLIKPWQKIFDIAKNNCSFLIFESGDSGKRNPIDINRLVEWATGVLTVTGLIQENNLKKKNHPQKYSNYLFEIRAEYDCFFIPKLIPGALVGINSQIGEIVDLKTKIRLNIHSRHEGKLLWQKHECPVCGGETLFAIAC
jgi:uncharacterized protein